MDVKTKVKELDELRLSHLDKLVKSKGYREDIKHYLRFLNLTHSSLKYLEGLAKIDASKHHACLVDKKIKQIRFIRKKEILLLAKVVKQEGLFGRLLMNDFIRGLSELLLKRYVKLEVHYANVVIKIAESSQHEAEQIHQLVRWEERKGYAYLLISGSFWLIPVVGTLLFILSSMILGLLNEFSPNYQKLVKKLE